MSDGEWKIVAPLAGDRSLRGLPALKRLRPDQRDALQRKLQPRDYRRGEVIYHADDAARSLYVVLAGVVRLSIPSPNGRRILLNLLPAGEIFGHTALVEVGFAHVGVGGGLEHARRSGPTRRCAARAAGCPGAN